jgi:hypothetical protein
MSISGSNAATVAQAQGIITVQADCTRDEALRLMIERAQLTRWSVPQVASAVIAHRIWFHPELGEPARPG